MIAIAFGLRRLHDWSRPALWAVALGLCAGVVLMRRRGRRLHHRREQTLLSLNPLAVGLAWPSGLAQNQAPFDGPRPRATR